MLKQSGRFPIAWPGAVENELESVANIITRASFRAYTERGRRKKFVQMTKRSIVAVHESLCATCRPSPAGSLKLSLNFSPLLIMHAD